MIERNSEIKKYLKNPFHSLSLLIADAENWLDSFRKHHSE
jgi:hypothetical protein